MKIERPHIGQYELQQRLARTSTGEVWRAYDSARRCAVIIRFSRADAAAAAGQLQRYIQGVERVASLHHPNIVPIHDIRVQPGLESSDSLICLDMPYVGGESLADYLRRTSASGKIPLPAEVVDLFTSLALAQVATPPAQSYTHPNMPTSVAGEPGEPNALRERRLGSQERVQSNTGTSPPRPHEAMRVWICGSGA